MANQAGAQFRFRWEVLPFLPGALDYARQWVFAGGAETNEKAAQGQARFAGRLHDWQRMVLFDPQTSGGLLVALAPELAGPYVAAMQAAGESAWLIGEVVAGSGIDVQ